MGTPAEFRTHAERCIELARKTNNPAQRETLVEIAETWLGLAGASPIEFEELKRDGLATEDRGGRGKNPMRQSRRQNWWRRSRPAAGRSDIAGTYQYIERVGTNQTLISCSL